MYFCDNYALAVLLCVVTAVPRKKGEKGEDHA